MLSYAVGIAIPYIVGIDKRRTWEAAAVAAPAAAPAAGALVILV